MIKRALLTCLFAAMAGILPVSLHASKSFKKATIDRIIKHKKVARYSIYFMDERCSKFCVAVRKVHLIDLIKDIIELQPRAHGFVKGSKRNQYCIMCMEELQIEDAQFVKLLVPNSLFIIPEIGTVIGTLGGATYRLEKAERVKATLKNPEQISLILSVAR